MATIIQGETLSTFPLQGKRIAIIGYGNQGRPQALNLRDAGFDVRAGQRQPSEKWELAQQDGMEMLPIEEAVSSADFVLLALPDEAMAQTFKERVAPYLQPHAVLAFCHGFNLLFGLIEPEPTRDVVLIGPKGTGPSLRANFLAKKGTPCLVAIHQNASGTARDYALAYAAAVGSANSFVVETTIHDETVADLFGEQAILCGGIPELIKSGMETLIRAGISPEVAYFECLCDAKLVLDLLYERGFEGMRRATSATAQYGGLTQGTVIIDPQVQSKFAQILKRIESGEFARDWMKESASGSPLLEKLRNQEADSVAEAVSTRIRSNMLS